MTQRDGTFITSSGVSAGIDAAFAALARLDGEEAARRTALRIEYAPRQNPDDDPFAVAP